MKIVSSFDQYNWAEGLRMRSLYELLEKGQDGPPQDFPGHLSRHPLFQKNIPVKGPLGLHRKDIFYPAFTHPWLWNRSS